MFYHFRFDLLFLFAFVVLLILNMTMGASRKSEVKTAAAVVESQNSLDVSSTSENPIVKN